VERLLGLPVDRLATVLAVLLATAFGLLAVLALRNRVFVRMSARNVARRRGRSALIVVGLMLATTIISASLATGDTMARSLRSSVFASLGATDEVVATAGAELDPRLGIDSTTRPGFFDEAEAGRVRDALASSPVDGVAGAIVTPVAVQDLSARQTEPLVGLFGAEPASLDGFGAITTDAGPVSLADLGPAEAYVTEEAVDDMGARPGDRLVVYGSSEPVELTVRDVVRFRGAGTDGPAVLTDLAVAQAIVGEPGRISQVLVSNTGGESAGVGLTDDVVRALEPALDGRGLEVQPIKRDRIEQADEAGNAFLQMFSTMGSFSIAAGILLIFLIFVMLSAERRTEMGIARALGTQRGHLVQSFLYEGAIYDLVAAGVGSLAGLGVAYVMVEAVAAAFTTGDLALQHAVRPQSLLIAYGLGVLLTLAVVAVSAWRVSRLDVVAAVRNLPSPVRRRPRRAQWRRGALAAVVGGLVTAVGVSSGGATAFLLGVSIVIIGLVPVARALGAGDRLAHTLGGVALVVWWLLPFRFYDALAGELTWGFSVWVVAGIVVVLGATWTIMHNADVALDLVARTLGRVRALAPVVRMAVAYPLRSRLRTSMTLAMFTIVVFTLVTGATISGSFIGALDDVEQFGGGFDVRGVVAPVRPIEDIHAEVAADDALAHARIDAIGGQSTVPVEVRQAGEGAFADYPLRGVDDEFVDTTTYELATVAEGYGSSADAWRALADHPGLAIVDPYAVPRRNDYGSGVRPDFRLSGFYLEDEGFAPVDVDVRDPATGADMTVTVIGVLGDNSPFEMAGLTTSQATLAPLGDRAAPTTFWFRLGEGGDADATAAALESAFLDRGFEAQTLQDRLDEAVGVSWTMNRLVQGFIGLGLVVGVVALGVVSARAVVERRQQIGVLRAIGFQPSMVRLAFLIEASFVSLVAIAVGCALGLAIAANVIAYAGAQQGATLAVPWLNLAVIFAAVYLAALASTYLPALRASRVYPAEALRYE
jgi:putative ABC transport system permease protein